MEISLWTFIDCHSGGCGQEIPCQDGLCNGGLVECQGPECGFSTNPNGMGCSSPECLGGGEYM